MQANQMLTEYIRGVLKNDNLNIGTLHYTN
jgi:hypothetical protein